MTRNPVNRNREWENSHPMKSIDKVYIDLIIKNVGAPDESFSSMVAFLYNFYMSHKDDAGITK
jgi:hypothetical protein